MPLLDEVQQGEIEQDVLRVRELSRSSEDCLELAERALLEALGLQDLQVQATRCFEATSTNVTEAGRIDAEYFQPAKRGVLDALRSVPGAPLSCWYESVRVVFNPRSVGDELVVRNFDLNHALEPFLDEGVCTTTAGGYR